MSECVVRMEMPANCGKCDLWKRCKLYTDYIWSLSDYFPTRPKPNPLDRGCLIICQLPEGHGRLVDADALLRDIDQFHVSDGCFQHWLELQPTIVPAERRKMSYDEIY